jgi:hypothetical protein
MRKHLEIDGARYGIRVGKREAVVGFRYPASKFEPDAGDNIVRDGEVRVASHCLAVLGMPSPMQYVWTHKASAAYVASAIPKARVEVLKKI